MNVVDLFSGIGGFSIGLERTGMETVLFCESEDYPVSILNKHWPHVPVHRDIRKLDGNQYRGAIDLVCGGFPCQPFSTAGKQRGKEDDRYLWPEMLRFIDESKPTWVIGENVAGLVGMGFETVFTKLESQTLTRDENHDYFNSVLTRQETMCLDQICQGLEKIGYEVQPLIIPACAIGAIHRRDRVWIIAYAMRGRERDAETINKPTRHEKRDNSPHREKRETVSGETGRNDDNVTNTEHNGLVTPQKPRSDTSSICGPKKGQNEPGQPERVCASSNVADPQGQRCREKGSDSGRSSKRTAGSGDSQADTDSKVCGRNESQSKDSGGHKKPKGATRRHDINDANEFRPVPIPTQCPVRHRDDELSDNVARLKALGNAVMPENAEMIGRSIMLIVNQELS